MIHYVTGDAVNPQIPGMKIIAHIVNDAGGWGRGFVVPLGRKYPRAERDYRYYSKARDLLGKNFYSHVAEDILIVHMCAQHGYRSATNPVPLQYDALESCLRELDGAAKNMKAVVCCPRFGCGLAGGTWSEVEKLIQKIMPDVEVYVHDLEK